MIGPTRVLPAVLLAAALLVATGCSGSSKPRATTAPTSSAPAGGSASRVDVYGDSLTLQARDALRVEGRAHGLNVTVNAFFGLAPCDVRSYVMRDIAKVPDALVIAFSGNNISPCMQHDGKDIVGAPYYAAYRRDIGTMVGAATAKGILTFVVAPPVFPPSQNVPDRVRLDAVLRAVVAAHPGARYVESAPVVSPTGFSRTEPCLPGETAALGCRNGQITVRSGNGIHFDEPHAVPCPTGSDHCSYSAGAHRYALAILGALAGVKPLSYVAAASDAGVPIDTTKEH